MRFGEHDDSAVVTTRSVDRGGRRRAKELTASHEQVGAAFQRSARSPLSPGCVRIGNQIALDLAARGARVFGVDVQAGPLYEDPGITALVCDLADTEAYRALLTGIENDCGRVDVLANVAGIDEPLSAVGADTAFYRRILE